jgi:hypothetical protein
MDKPYINLTELQKLLKVGRTQGKRIMNHLLEVAKEKNYFIPENNKEILIPTHLVKSELKIGGGKKNE